MAISNPSGWGVELRLITASLAIFLIMLTVALGESNSASTVNNVYGSSSINGPDPLIWIDRGNSSGSMGRYNESIAFYDKAISLLDERVTMLLRRSHEVQIRLNNSLLEYDQLNQIFQQAEGEYNPQRRMEKALLDAEARVILSMIPNPRVGPGKGTEIPIQETGSIGGIFGIPGIVRDTIDAFKWNDGEREEHLQKMRGKLNEINNTRKEYGDVMVDLLGASSVLSSAWAGKSSSLYHLGRYVEAIEASDTAIELYPNNALGWVNKGAALMVLHRDAEANEALDNARRLGYDALGDSKI
jgi:tetratricopeptide (TPR) repeat protein